MAEAGRNDLPTPAIVIDAEKATANLRRLASYAQSHNLKIRPHTKTHKSLKIGKLQLGLGAIGLTVAKPGEANVMAEVADDLLIAYPAVDANRARRVAELAKTKTVRVGIDSTVAASLVSEAAQSIGSRVGVLVDLNVGLHRTGVQSPEAALALAQFVSSQAGLRLDGIMFYPGHIGAGSADQQKPLLAEVAARVGETIEQWRKSGLQAAIVSGGSTPTAYQSHFVPQMTEIRPGTYVFNDMNCVRGGFGITLDDCAATLVATVMSDAVPGQIVIDAGSKALTQDRCGPAPDSGFGYVVELPEAEITKLSEEHGQIDVSACKGAVPKVGDRLTIIPNHICPCINLQDQVYWLEQGNRLHSMPIDARGRVF